MNPTRNTLRNMFPFATKPDMLNQMSGRRPRQLQANNMLGDPQGLGFERGGMSHAERFEDRAATKDT
jgi:hypothetical protein